MVEQAKNTCEQVFGKRLRELRKVGNNQSSVQELCEDYDFYSYETQNGEEAAAFSAHCSSTLTDVRIRTACGTS